jgi:hypothetical protein
MRALPLGLAALIMALSPATAGEAVCGGHQLLVPRRPEMSCWNIAPQIIEAPNRAFRAVIYPADISLDATPDMESRVVIRTQRGDTVGSRDHSSPRGANGYYVYRGAWSPDSQYFVYSLVSSGGHSPWSFPIMVFSAKRGQFAPFSEMIGNRPTLSGDFSFSGAHALTAMTWPRDGDIEHKLPVTVDLEAAFARIPPSSD